MSYHNLFSTLLTNHNSFITYIIDHKSVFLTAALDVNVFNFDAYL